MEEVNKHPDGIVVNCPHCHNKFMIAFVEAAEQLASKGGKRTKQKHGKDHYSRIGKQGADKRWKK